MTFIISKEIGIDMGHRVPDHMSKCRNFHGHRYRVILEVHAPQVKVEGSEKGMVKDFSFLKDLLMSRVNDPFDHGMTLSFDDPLLPQMYPAILEAPIAQAIWTELEEHNAWYVAVKAALPGDDVPMKLNIMAGTPTAENLAQMWYHLLEPEIVANGAEMESLTVWETPTSMAVYKPGKD